jgi:hypothetical protein
VSVGRLLLAETDAAEGRSDSGSPAVARSEFLRLIRTLVVSQDWDAEHGPTNADVAKGIGGIWEVIALASRCHPGKGESLDHPERIPVTALTLGCGAGGASDQD